MQINDFELFLAKCPAWNETRTWCVAPPTACIYQVSNWYLKTCRKKARKTSKNPKRTKIMAKIPKMIFLQKNGTYVKKYTAGHLCTQFEEFIFIYEAMIAKKCVWPTFGSKLGQIDPIVMQLKLDMSCHLLNVYTKFQIDISKRVEEKSGKPGRTDVFGEFDLSCHEASCTAYLLLLSCLLHIG